MTRTSVSPPNLGDRARHTNNFIRTKQTLSFSSHSSHSALNTPRYWNLPHILSNASNSSLTAPTKRKVLGHLPSQTKTHHLPQSQSRHIWYSKSPSIQLPPTSINITNNNALLLLLSSLEQNHTHPLRPRRRPNQRDPHPRAHDHPDPRGWSQY